MRFPMYLPGPNRVQIVNEEPRAAMVAQLDTPLGVITVANTHLSFVPGWNHLQLNRLMRDLRGLPGPRVLMGDLNMPAPAPARRTGLASAGQRADVSRFSVRNVSSTTSSPTMTALVATEVCTPVLPISDHRPLVIDVSLR